MASNEVIELLKCAIGHICSKETSIRCANCELDFQEIVEDPCQLTCGHTICTKCTEKKSGIAGIATCRFHGITTIGNEALMSKIMLGTQLDGLFELLNDKFKKITEIYEGLFYFKKKSLDHFKKIFVNVESRNEEKMESYILIVKDIINLRAERLKAQIDTIRETLFNRLHDFKVQANK